MSGHVTERKVTNPKGNVANLTGMGKGRPKGATNKFSNSVKDQILAALDKLGGVDYLVRLGHEQPAIFGSLLGRVIPTQLALNSDGELLGVVLIPAKRPVGSRDLSPAPAPTIEGRIEDAEVVSDDPGRPGGDGEVGEAE